MVKEIQSLDEFEREIAGPGLVVVDFFTTWCGPCKAIAPVLEGLAAKYPEVKFIKVDIEKNEDIAAPRRISSIPTFHFMVKGQMVHEMKGANAGAIEQKVQELKVEVNPFKGAGNRLSENSGDPNAPAMSAREARLKAFGAHETAKQSAPKPGADGPVSKQSGGEAYDDEEEALSKALALSLADGQGQPQAAPAAKAQPAATGSAGGSGAKQSAQDEADFAAAAAEFDAQDNAAPQHFQEAPGQTWEEEMVSLPYSVFACLSYRTISREDARVLRPHCFLSRSQTIYYCARFVAST
jgi:thioredoxin 1